MITMMVNNPIIKHQLDDLFVPSLVKEINGHMVGLVGYLTPHTKFISNSGKVILKRHFLCPTHIIQ